MFSNASPRLHGQSSLSPACSDWYIINAGGAFLGSAVLLIVLRTLAAHIYAGEARLDFYLTDWTIVRKLCCIRRPGLPIARSPTSSTHPTDNILITLLIRVRSRRRLRSCDSD